MPRTVKLASTAAVVAVYLCIGVAGVIALTQGQPIGWIGVGISTLGIGLRVAIEWLRRWQLELAAREIARRAEPGYVKPVIDPADASRRRTIISIAYIGPPLAITIAAIWFALASPSDLQPFAATLAFALLVATGAVVVGIRKGLRKRDDG
ncbi:hypothetical protein [Cryobacterium tagatosivorans]|uniref:Uncharacterized protein n=1 Tax=Cryobacterium tagatosivorans TaxID=1259199 RepID=A0A4R8UCY2_9MICO|nr:hypothetical protein [Cryobacterium tagatosivorans]TFB47352.1 hypothetical protein E3O23_15180 [Cryobacterium tagatosivorans]